MDVRLNLHTLQVPLVSGRSYRDWCDALAYSLFLINKGRIGSRQEREYIDAERAQRSYRRMASSIKDFKYEEDDDEIGEDEENTKPATSINEAPSTPHSESDDGGKVADDEAAMKQGLLNESMRSSSMSSRRSSVSSASSVTPRANGKNSFKYKCCSICLTDFESGNKVKVLPVCGHTFHGECLEQWLVR